MGDTTFVPITVDGHTSYVTREGKIRWTGLPEWCTNAHAETYETIGGKCIPFRHSYTLDSSEQMARLFHRLFVWLYKLERYFNGD